MVVGTADELEGGSRQVVQVLDVDELVGWWPPDRVAAHGLEGYRRESEQGRLI